MFVLLCYVMLGYNEQYGGGNTETGRYDPNMSSYDRHNQLKKHETHGLIDPNMGAYNEINPNAYPSDNNKPYPKEYPPPNDTSVYRKEETKEDIYPLINQPLTPQPYIHVVDNTNQPITQQEKLDKQHSKHHKKHHSHKDKDKDKDERKEDGSNSSNSSSSNSSSDSKSSKSSKDNDKWVEQAKLLKQESEKIKLEDMDSTIISNDRHPRYQKDPEFVQINPKETPDFYKELKKIAKDKELRNKRGSARNS